MARRTRSPDARPPTEPAAPRDGRRQALFLTVAALPVLVAFYALILWWSLPHTAGRELRLDQFRTLVADGRVQDATILETDNRITGTYDGGRYWVASSGREPIFGDLVAALTEAGIPTAVEQQPLKGLVGPVTLFLPALIIIDGLFVIFLIFGRGADGLMNFGKSRGRRVEGGDATITFADVAGVEEAVEELEEVRDYLANADRFLAMGATVPKGVLLTGPPGCGKTLLARALAGEAQVPFFSISGADFVELFVGVGAARTRDFFKVAKQAAPCIVFIDELDAMGRGRSVMVAGAQDEREATLNQLLVEMDGFESGSGVVVLAATNRPDILDEALLRPGRFDRRIAVDRPDLRGRQGVLAIHARGKPLGPDVDLSVVARRTAGFSGADLANVVNEAALLAARRGAETIGARHLSEAVERVVAGPERRSRILSAEDRRRIATHEAGHAVASAGLPGTDAVAKVSIVARGHGSGFTWWAAGGDSPSASRSQLLDRMAALLAGRAAEELVLGEVSTGATADLEVATRLARRMVADFGMSERLGPLAVRPPGLVAAADGSGLGHSEELAAEVDREVRALLGQAHARAVDTLQRRRRVLDAVVAALLEEETLEGPALDELLLAAGTAAPATSG